MSAKPDQALCSNNGGAPDESPFRRTNMPFIKLGSVEISSKNRPYDREWPDIRMEI